MPDTTQQLTADDALQARFETYDETFDDIDTRLSNLESFIRGNDKLCPPDGNNTFCEQAGGKRKKRRRKSRKKKRKTNKKKRKRKRKTKRKRRR